MNPIPKIELRLNEENEFSFKMSIQGTTSDPKSKPKFRFIITDFGSDKGILYPCKKESNDVVKVTIPALKENYKVNRKYIGKLEVILGNLYFTPTEFLISFVEPLNIKVTPVSSQLKQNINTQVESDEVESDEVESDEAESDEVESDEVESDEAESDEVESDEAESDEVESDEAESDEVMEEKPKYMEEPHQLTSENKINFDEFFISDPTIRPVESLSPETVGEFTQIAFSKTNPPLKSGTVLTGPGFGTVPVNVQKTFTASGFPNSDETNNDSFQESKLSKEATTTKNNLKKAFLEALQYHESQEKEKTQIKESVTKKSFIEEAKLLLLSASENRKKKLSINKKNHVQKTNETIIHRPKNLKELFTKDLF